MKQKKMKNIIRAPKDIFPNVTKQITSQIKSTAEPYVPKRTQPLPEATGTVTPNVEPPSYATPTAINRVDAQATTSKVPPYAAPTQINRMDTQVVAPKVPPLPSAETVITPTQINRMDAETVYQDLMKDRDKITTVVTHYQTGVGDMDAVIDALAELQEKYGVTGSDFAAYVNGDQEGAVRQLYDQLPAPRKDGPGFLSRIRDMASGGGKASGAAFVNALADLYRTGQGGRDRENQEWLEQYSRDLEQAKRGLAQAEELELEEPGKWKSDVKSWQNIVDVCQIKYDAMARVVEGKVQEKATAAAHDWADDIQASAQEDLARAKEGLGQFGQAAADAGAATVQSAIDFMASLALGVPSMLPFVFRAYGSGSQKARQDGADEIGQNAYGVGIAATEFITEKLFGLALPFYGDGTMDDAVKRGISKAVNRLAKTKTGQRVLDSVLTLGAGAFGEGLEEVIADWAQWQMPRIYGGDVASAEETVENSLYDFFVGTIAGMMGETVNPETYRYDPGMDGQANQQEKSEVDTPQIEDESAPSSISHVLDLVRQANAMAEEKWGALDQVPQAVRDGLKAVTDLNLAAAKRNALGDLLGYPREFQKTISSFLDKVIADAEDVERWEGMPPEVKQFFQPQLEEKESGLQWLEDRLAKMEEPVKDTLPLPDIHIGVSLGAKAKNYEVIDKGSGIVYHFLEGTHLQNVEVFAGSGVRSSLDPDVAEGLAQEFGGDPSAWQHVKGFGELTIDGEESRPAEVHWFQAAGVGKVKFIFKGWLDE